MAMHKTILLDLGKVLVPFDFERGYQALAPHCPYPPGEIPERIRATALVAPFERGEMTPQDFVARLTAELEVKLGYEEFCQIWSSIFLPETLIADAMIAGLHRRYRLVLLSNTNAIHFAMIRENYPILRHFDEFVLSYEVGALKPSPRIYEAAIRAARCEPGACFYADDIAEFAEAARQAGIDAVQFLNQEQLAGELRRRGIEWEEHFSPAP